MKTKDFLKEIARDLISLGSPIFFLLVLVRVSMTANYIYLSEFIISGILFLALMLLFNANVYSGLGFVALVFTSIYYSSINFTIFGTALYFALLFSLFYLKHDLKEIIKGAIFGILSAGIGYYIVRLIFG